MNKISINPSWGLGYDNNIIYNKQSLLYTIQKNVGLLTILFKSAYVGAWFELQEFAGLISSWTYINT